MNRIDYPSTVVETDVTRAEKNAPVGYRNEYDFTQNSGGYGSKEDYRPESSWSGSAGEGAGGGWYGPSYGTENQYPAAGHEYYGHKTLSNGLTKIFHQKHRENAIDWRKIGVVLALVKLGLVKLKALGFLKVLFFLGFKLAVFVKTILFKFVLIKKLVKFFKILVLPALFAVTLLPTFAQLLSAVAQLADIIRRRVDNTTAASPALNTLTNLPGGLLSGRPTGTDILGGLTGSRLPGGNSGTGLSVGNRPAGTTVGSLSSKRDDDPSSMDDEQYYEPLELFDPASAIFQKVLDSEKCVERIACQIAAAEKAGVIPFWISWMLYQISKFIPNEKLESYLKTYRDVNNKIHTEPSTLNNWVTWCSERYDCSNNNITNEK